MDYGGDQAMTALAMRTAFQVALAHEHNNYTPEVRFEPHSYKARKLNQIADDMTVEVLRREYEEKQNTNDNARA